MAHEIRLLVVDDNMATRYAVRRVLEHRGCVVTEAATGGDGLAMVRAQTFDALILDVNLPDISGFDIVRQLRQDPATALLPVVHVSASSVDSPDVITGLNGGADAYLIHPVDPDVLLATVRTLLRVRDTDRALGASEARFRDIVEHVAAPIAVIDEQLQLHERNPAFLRLLPDEHPVSRLADYLADGQTAVLDGLRQHLAAGRPWQGALGVQARDTLRETEWRVVPYREPGLGLAFIEDVTERRERERAQQAQLHSTTRQLAQEVEEHARTEAQLRQAQKMDALGRLTGGIAHDFNNLLTGIITAIELIDRRVDEGRLDIKRFSSVAIESARRAAALTHRMLAFARQQPLDAQAVDINEHVRSLKDLLRRTIGETVNLQFELEDEPLVARVDASQLENAVLNLVINARDALPGGGGTVRVSTEVTRLRGDTELDDGDYVALKVSDDGAGMPAGVAEQAFEPFFTTKPIGQGTGLGLSMIYGFVRQSGGGTRIVTAEGQGTEVTLLLPVAKSLPAIDRPRPPLAARGGGEHVLLVEDEPPVRALIAQLLEEAGYRCTPLGSVESALRVLHSEAAFDLLITDIGLPGMNGRELANRARALRPDVPILLITGYAGSAIEHEDYLAPGMDILVKPFEIDGLLGKVRDILDEVADDVAVPSARVGSDSQ